MKGLHQAVAANEAEFARSHGRRCVGTGADTGPRRYRGPDRQIVAANGRERRRRARDTTGRYRPAVAATARRAACSIRRRMARRYFSRKYYNSPMPHAIFFYRGFAIHGTNDIARLGGPASHGCVRLHPSHAAALFALVAARRAAQHADPRLSNVGRRRRVLNPSITLPIIDEISCATARYQRIHYAIRDRSCHRRVTAILPRWLAH